MEVDGIPPPPGRLLSHVRRVWPASECKMERARWFIGDEQNEVVDFSPQRGGYERIWAAGSVHLHNRREIDAQLEKRGIRPCATDLQRIAAGFESSGESWFLRLRGPFAAVIGDSEGNILIARDQVGVSPLYYLATTDEIYVSTDLRVLTELDGFDWSLDPLGLAHAVSGLWGDPEATVWRQIRRLPAGHFIRISGGRMRLSDYWMPAERIRFQNGGDFIEYAEGIGTLLYQAVDRNLGPGRTALDLSGGLDSSTVAGFAAGNAKRNGVRPLALTFDISDPRYTDRPFAEAVAAMHDLDLQLIPVGASGTGARDRARRWRDLPGNYLWDEVEHSRKLAVQAGACRYLTGHMGDVVFVGEGWAALMRHFYRPNPYYVLKHSYWGRRLPANLVEILRRHPWYAAAGDRLRPLGALSFLNPELRSAAGLDKRRVNPNPLHRNAGLVARARNLRTPQLQRVLELLHRLAIETGLAVGHPLADVDLVEYVLSIPPEYFVGVPANRRLHAAAADTVLPGKVVARPDKADFTWSALDAVESQNPDGLLARSVLAANDWIDRDQARAVLRRVRECERRKKNIGGEIWEIVGLVETEVFLQTAATRSGCFDSRGARKRSDGGLTIDCIEKRVDNGVQPISAGGK